MGKYGHVAVLMGDLGSEREVSLQSGAAVFAALQERGIKATLLDIKGDLLPQLQRHNFDRAFIAMHGGQGEGGAVQAVLDVMGIPYTTASMSACALCLDKLRSKIVWAWAGIPTPAFHAVASFADLEKLTATLTYPVAIKPSNEGSTVGVSKVTEAAELKAAFELAQQYSEEVLVESWIEGTEYTVTLLGDRALPSIKIVPASGLYDYDAKYISEETQFICPSDLSVEDELQIQQLSLRAYKILGGSAWGRLDMVRDKDGKFWLLEANTIPGLTSHSLVPKAAKAVGMSYADLVLAILDTSLISKSEPEKMLLPTS